MESLKLSEVRSFQSEPAILPPTATISKMLGVLRDLGVYEVFVPLGGKLGMVTARDLLSASNLEAKIRTLAKYVPKLSPRSSVAEAARIMMNYRIRALPIVEDGEVTGEVNSLSILNALKNLPSTTIKVRHIMTANPITVDEGDPVSKARNIMVKQRIDHLPTLGGRKLVGIITSNHIAVSMLPPEGVERGVRGLEGQKKLNFPVRDLMDRKLLVCELEDDILTVLRDMLDKKGTYTLATMWREELQGIITHRDYMKLLVEPETEDIPIYIVGLPDDPFEAEVAKAKFRRAVSLLKRHFPDIEEARATIKDSAPVEGKRRRRYEVDMAIKTTKELHTYSETGWDLPQIFDILTNRMKRLMAQKPTPTRSFPQSEESTI
ncbi:MAG: CBS domain-containing protein [Candidatus Bathyarchaeia archaeon]